MQNLFHRLKSLKLRHKIGIILLVLLFVLGIRFFIEYPRDLGAELQYVGREDKWCSVLALCGSGIHVANYYFATDMSEEELREYFKKAKYASLESSDNSSGYKILDYNYPDSPQGMSLYLYTDTSTIPEDVRFKLEKTGKRWVIEIDESDYSKFKEALE